MAPYQPLTSAEVSPDLFDKVMLRLEVEQRRQALRRRLFVLAAPFLAALALVVPVWNSFQFNLSHSGFTDYLSLGFYDFKLVAVQWQDFSLSLLETFPMVNSIELLTVVLALLFTLKLLVASTRAWLATSRALSNTRTA